MDYSDQALDLDPDNPEILVFRFEVLQKLGEQTQALETIQKAIDLSQDPVPLMLQKADILFSSDVEGEYPLKPEFSLDPVVSVLAMEEEEVFAEVSPVVIQILDWIPRSRSATDLIPMRELGPVLKAYRSKK